MNPAKKGLSELTNLNAAKKTGMNLADRQTLVERYMLAGMSLTQILGVRVKDGGRTRPIGSNATIQGDMAAVRSRWLANDTEWFSRASMARIEAVSRLKARMADLNGILASVLDGGYGIAQDAVPTKATYIIAQLTTVIVKIYEIDSDFDPEQYLDSRVRESVLGKIAEAEKEAAR